MNETKERLIERLKLRWKSVLLDPSIIDDAYDEIAAHVIREQWIDVKDRLPDESPELSEARETWERIRASESTCLAEIVAKNAATAYIAELEKALK